MKKKIFKYIKVMMASLLIASLTLPSYAAVSASDGSAFVTKAEFDAALSDFNARLTTFEAGINSKIDSQVSSYLDRNGIWNGKDMEISKYSFYIGKEFTTGSNTRMAFGVLDSSKAFRSFDQWIAAIPLCECQKSGLAVINVVDTSPTTNASGTAIPPDNRRIKILCDDGSSNSLSTIVFNNWFLFMYKFIKVKPQTSSSYAYGTLTTSLYSSSNTGCKFPGIALSNGTKVNIDDNLLDEYVSFSPYQTYTGIRGSDNAKHVQPTIVTAGGSNNTQYFFVSKGDILTFACKINAGIQNSSGDNNKLSLITDNPPLTEFKSAKIY